MNVLAIIPARGGSKGIPRKNLQEVVGRPLISFAIERAKSACLVDRVIVSTDDEEIAAVAREWGADVPFLRPAELATDAVSLIPVVQHAARALDATGWISDVVVSVQPTAPFLASETIDAGVKLLLDTGCDSVAGVRRIEHNHPYRAHRLDERNGRIEPLHPEGEKFLQRQDLPAMYAFSGGLYVRERSVLNGWSGHDFCLGRDRRAVIVDERESLNVDTPLDLAVFRAMMEEQPDQK